MSQKPFNFSKYKTLKDKTDSYIKKVFDRNYQKFGTGRNSQRNFQAFKSGYKQRVNMNRYNALTTRATMLASNLVASGGRKFDAVEGYAVASYTRHSKRGDKLYVREREFEKAIRNFSKLEKNYKNKQALKSVFKSSKSWIQQLPKLDVTAYKTPGQFFHALNRNEFQQEFYEQNKALIIEYNSQGRPEDLGDALSKLHRAFKREKMYVDENVRISLDYWDD